MRPADLVAAVTRRWRGLPHRPRRLPVLVLNVTNRCSCRCLTCDIWRPGRVRRELGPGDVEPHLGGLRRLGVRQVVLSGGEPLDHADLWGLCRLLDQLDVSLTLLTAGLELARDAAHVARFFDRVIVSLDGPEAVHDAIRRVPGAYDRLADGIEALRAIRPGLEVTARCVLQKGNFRHLRDTADCARELGLDRISFLAADSSSTAFNRPDGWSPERVAAVVLDRAEVAALSTEVERAIHDWATELPAGFVAEPPDRLRSLVRHYAALLGDAEPEPRRCNAPWVSAVVEADGRVRPCFFHAAVGSLADGSLETVLGSDRAVAFRRGLDVTTDPVCRGCVCTLWIDPREVRVGPRDRRQAPRRPASTPGPAT